jgi:hypothetical protein
MLIKSSQLIFIEWMKQYHPSHDGWNGLDMINKTSLSQGGGGLGLWWKINVYKIAFGWFGVGTYHCFGFLEGWVDYNFFLFPFLLCIVFFFFFFLDLWRMGANSHCYIDCCIDCYISCIVSSNCSIDFRHRLLHGFLS